MCLPQFGVFRQPLSCAPVGSTGWILFSITKLAVLGAHSISCLSFFAPHTFAFEARIWGLGAWFRALSVRQLLPHSKGWSISYTPFVQL